MTQSQLDAIMSFSYQIMSSSSDRQHGIDHLNRVWNNAQKIAQSINLTTLNFLRLLQSACYLHDLSTATHPPSLSRYFLEARWTEKITDPFLHQINLPAAEIELINAAIHRHHLSVPWHRLNRRQLPLIQILQDADTIDFFHPARLHHFPPIFQTIGGFGQKHIHWFLNQPQIAVPISRSAYS